MAVKALGPIEELIGAVLVVVFFVIFFVLDLLEPDAAISGGSGALVAIGLSKAIRRIRK